MRCLYCNKKLSLLKLAKGDSFCSPEHFDAHQLQLSKDAFERLMNQAAEEAPKAPLVVPQREPKSAPAQVDEGAVLARLAAMAPPPTPEAEAFQSPPYAPFAIDALAAYSLDPAFPVNGEDGGRAMEAPRQLAFPVHDLEATACILNLYLRLRLADTEPRDWTSTPHLIVTPEDFGLEVRIPAAGLRPEYAPVENLAEVETIAPFEAVPPSGAAAPAEATAVVVALPLGEIAPSIWPVMPAKTGSIWTTEFAESKVPFLVAPSYLPRAGGPIVVHSAATSVPNAAVLQPVLDKGTLPRIDSCDAIPDSTRFAESTAFHLQDSTHWMASAAELTVEPAFLRPGAKEPVRKYAWQPSNSEIGIARPALESKWVAMQAHDFDLPAAESLIVRQEAARLAKVDPQQLLGGISAMDLASLFRGVLETRPYGDEPSFADLPADAMECGWRTTLAPFPSRKAVAAAWQDSMSYFSLPDPIAAGSPSPMPSLEALEHRTACVKIEGIEKAELPRPYGQKDWYRPAAWPESDFAIAPYPAEPGLVMLGSTRLVDASQVPAGSLKRGSGDPALEWQASEPVPPAQPPAKFLPVRDGAILPAAKAWPRLGTLPR